MPQRLPLPVVVVITSHPSEIVCLAVRMSFRFRHTFTLFPGVRLNLSGSGMSVSLGVPGAPLNLKPGRSPRATVGLPGSGISFQTSLDEQTSRSPGLPQYQPQALPHMSQPGVYAERDIASNAVEDLTSASLSEVKEMLVLAHQERRDLEREVAELCRNVKSATSKVRWLSFPVWGWLLKGPIERARTRAETFANDLFEAETALRGHGIAIHWELDEGTKASYEALRATFDKARMSSAIWDLVHDAQIDRPTTRSFADRSIERKRVSFDWERPNILPAQDDDPYPRVPHLENANGGDIYLFPGFLLVMGPDDFALLHPASLRIGNVPVRFKEDEAMPADAQVVGHTWQYVNKNGQPDRRFKHNPRSPLALYTNLTLTNPEGLNEEYLLSNAQAGAALGVALQRWVQAIPKGPTKEAKAAAPIQSAPSTAPNQTSLPALASRWRYRPDGECPSVGTRLEEESVFLFFHRHPDGTAWVAAVIDEDCALCFPQDPAVNCLEITIDNGKTRSLAEGVEMERLLTLYGDGCHAFSLTPKVVAFRMWHGKSDEGLGVVGDMLTGGQLSVTLRFAGTNKPRMEQIPLAGIEGLLRSLFGLVEASV